MRAFEYEFIEASILDRDAVRQTVQGVDYIFHLAGPSILPLATPLVAGPSVIATLLVLVTSQPEAIGKWAAALLVTLAVSAAILICGPAIARILKETGPRAVERLMGMLLVMIAVQTFSNGLEHSLNR